MGYRYGKRDAHGIYMYYIKKYLNIIKIYKITRRYVITNLIIIFWNDLCEFLLLLIFSRQWNTSNYLLTWKGHCTRSDAQNFLLQMYSEHAAVQFTPFVIWEMGRQTRKEILRLAIFKFLSYSLLQYKLNMVSKPSKMLLPKVISQVFSMISLTLYIIWICNRLCKD